MSTIGDVALAIWLIVAEVTTIAVITLPLFNEALAVGVTMLATPSVFGRGRRHFFPDFVCAKKF